MLARQFPQLDSIEHLGQGGMGVVYKARQRQLNRLVAVKILPPSVGEDPAFAERFMREAQALARLNHPNIVQVYDFGQTNEFFYFVMEYVDGVNLRALIREGKLKPEEALRIVPQICEALQFAHDEGIVHRDIKPENILIDKKGRVKIADFGLAKILGHAAEDLSLTGTGQLMGTLGYMAPEQLQQAHKVDHRADIYSLGVVFYEMLTGQLPIGRFEPPSKKVQIDFRLDEIVLRSLESEPARRYQHASEVKSDVETVTSKPQVAPAAQVEAACATDSGARLLLDETDRAARRFQHYFEISGFIVIAFGVVIAVLVWSVNMLGLLPIPIALSIAGIACLVAAGRTGSSGKSTTSVTASASRTASTRRGV
jgi:serine/threonine-protein kinase